MPLWLLAKTAFSPIAAFFIDFYNQDGVCLPRGMDCMFKYNSGYS
jgi:hypothetical protein